MHATNTYAIFWLPSGYHFEGAVRTGSGGSDSNYESLMNRFLGDIGGSSYYNVLTQYGDDKNGTALNFSDFKGAYVDTSQYQQLAANGTLPDASIRNEILKVLNLSRWTGGSSNAFFVFTALGVNYNQCGSHSYFANPSSGQIIIYASLPDVRGVLDPGRMCANGMTPPTSSPNNDRWADAEISAVARQLSQAVTDPIPRTGWSSSSGAEIGDLCNGRYGTLDRSGGDVSMNGHEYVLQEDWSNKSGSCVIGLRPNTTFSLMLKASQSIPPNTKVGVFNLSYYTSGVNRWTLIPTSLSPSNLFVDPQTNLTLSNTADTNSERFCIQSDCANTLTTGVCSQSASACTYSFGDVYYYDLLLQRTSVAQIAQPNSIVLNYTSAPTNYSISPGRSERFSVAPHPGPTLNLWMTRGSLAAAYVREENASLSISTIDRWAVGSGVWNVTSPLTLPQEIVAFHQYLVSFSATIIGGGFGYSSPSVSYYEFGHVSYAFPGQPVWADAGTNYSYPDVLQGSSSGSERWVASLNELNGTISGPIVPSVPYYHQYWLSARFAAQGSSSTVPDLTVQGVAFGQPTNTTVPSGGTQEWLDSGTYYSFTGPSPSVSERWFTGHSLIGTMNAPQNLSLLYQHQFYVGLRSNPASGGVVRMSGSSQNASGWYSDGTQILVVASASPGYSFEGWAPSISGTTSNSSLSFSLTVHGPVSLEADFVAGGARSSSSSQQQDNGLAQVFGVNPSVFVFWISIVGLCVVIGIVWGFGASKKKDDSPKQMQSRE